MNCERCRMLYAFFLCLFSFNNVRAEVVTINISFFSEGSLTMNSTADFVECPGPTKEQMDVVIAVHFWLETFGQSLVCVVGFLANLVVIPILCG